MLHYCVAWYTWHCFFREKEDAGVDENAELEHETRLVYPIIGCFVGKITCVVAAYALIFKFLIETVIT